MQYSTFDKNVYFILLCPSYVNLQEKCQAVTEKKPFVNKILQLLCITNTKELFNIGKHYFKATQNKKCLAFNITNAYNCVLILFSNLVSKS
jgi:hypothetical protein